MNNKRASIELIDEMAKVKDDFKILGNLCPECLKKLRREAQ